MNADFRIAQQCYGMGEAERTLESTYVCFIYDTSLYIG
jgi:hypothetical protein